LASNLPYVHFLSTFSQKKRAQTLAERWSPRTTYPFHCWRTVGACWEEAYYPPTMVPPPTTRVYASHPTVCREPGHAPCEQPLLDDHLLHCAGVTVLHF